MSSILAHEIKEEVVDEPCCSTKSPSSLLDILIKSEQEGVVEDPLERMGDIGESVMSQLSNGNDSVNLRIQQNPLDLFAQAMYYPKYPEVRQKRKYTRRKSVTAPSSESTIQETNKKIDVHEDYYSQTKFDDSCPLLFPEHRKSEERVRFPRKKTEWKCEKLVNQKINKDVGKLMIMTNKKYGTKKWTPPDEKEPVKNYCGGLQEGQLNNVDQEELGNFYQNVCSVNGFSNFNIQEELLRIGDSNASGLKRKSNHKEEEKMEWKKEGNVDELEQMTQQYQLKSVPPTKEIKLEIEEIDDDVTKEEKQPVKNIKQERKPTFPRLVSGFTTFHPGAKYEMEKKFRTSTIKIFNEIFDSNEPKKRGRPKKKIRYADRVLDRVPEEPEHIRFKKDRLETLIEKFNTIMGNEEKEWSVEEINELGRWYEKFKVKMNFTIIQTKELSNFLRKIFGKLEQYEIERENDTALQEKRKFWQEYRKQHEIPRKTKNNRTAPVRRYIRSNVDLSAETEEERKKRKAAYLKEWRLRRAEKQNATTLLNAPGTSYSEADIRQCWINN